MADDTPIGGQAGGQKGGNVQAQMPPGRHADSLERRQEQVQAGAAKTGEADASDLLSLWGGASPKQSTSKTAQSAAPPAMPATPSSAPTQMLQKPAIPPAPVSAPLKTAPMPEPISTPASKPVPSAPAPPPSKEPPFRPSLSEAQAKAKMPSSSEVSLSSGRDPPRRDVGTSFSPIITKSQREQQPPPVSKPSAPPEKKEPPPVSKPSAPPEKKEPPPVLKPSAPPERKEPPPEKKEPLPERKEEVFVGEVVDAKSDATNGGPTEDQPDDQPGFRQQLDEFLAELHVSSSQIIFGAISVVILIGVGAGGYRLVKYFLNRPEIAQKLAVTAPPKEAQKKTIDVGETGISAAADVGSRSKVSPVFGGDTGILSALIFGLERSAQTPLNDYILTFKQLQNTYETDINELLNKSTDRRARLQSYLALLNSLYEKGNSFLTDLTHETEALSAEYDKQLAAQKTTDENFSEQLNAFNAQNTADALEKFIKISKNTIAVRSRLKALQQIRSFYATGLPKVARRIQDIELNRQALIAGLRVYDVKGSDLKLIVPVENGTSSGGNGGSAPSNSSSSLISGESEGGMRDFIRAPGGTSNIIIKPGADSKDFITAPGGGTRK